MNELKIIKEQLFDAPSDVKRAFNDVVKYFAEDKVIATNSNIRQLINDAIIPSINTPVNPINIYTNYSIKDIPISTETIHVNIPEHEDFEIINSFANKMLTEATPIDEEIQNVINDHFWDML